ncbi:hypothetical protein C8J57DRAFT_1378529 [Mycena rebaudengoi]|nr:hypothetical protein C8J57DRAFT_1378529 [Mycena rebaudengoi]
MDVAYSPGRCKPVKDRMLLIAMVIDCVSAAQIFNPPPRSMLLAIMHSYILNPSGWWDVRAMLVLRNPFAPQMVTRSS